MDDKDLIVDLPSTLKGVNISDFVQKLEKLHEKLCAIGQDEEATTNKKLTSLAKRLIEEELIKSSDTAIKVITACCLANILRIFAPEAPYNSNQIKSIFSLFVQLLKGLVTADDRNVYQNYLFYLTENLSQVKSVVLIWDLENRQGERDHLLLNFFKLSFALFPNNKIPKVVKNHLFDILQTLIEDGSTLPREVVRCIIAHCRGERPEEREFANGLIKFCSEKLVPSFGIYFNELFLQYTSTGSKNDDKDRQKNRKAIEFLHQQIVDVAKISPESVLGIIAHLENELHVEDVDLRLIAVKFVSQVFHCKEIDEIKSFPSLWSAWMMKMNDRDAKVRLQWVESACELFQVASFAVTQQLKEAIHEKLMDIDSKVRERCLFILGKYSTTLVFIKKLGPEICREITERCRDKIDDVRHQGLVVLMNIISALFSATETNGDLFGACVNGLFNLIYTNDKDLQIMYEYYIEHSILMPPSSVERSPTEHAQFIISIYRAMDDKSRAAFKKWLSDKVTFVKYFNVFLKLSSRDHKAGLPTIIQALSSLFRTPLPAQVYLQALHEKLINDDALRKLLEHLCDSSLKQETIQKAMITIAESDFEKEDSRLLNYLSIFLARRANAMFLNSNFISTILALPCKDSKELQVCEELIDEIISAYPSVGSAHKNFLEETLVSCIDDGKDLLGPLKTYYSLAKSCPGMIKADNQLLIDALKMKLEAFESRKEVKSLVRLLSLLSENAFCQEWLLEMEERCLRVIQANNFKVVYWQAICELSKNSHFGKWDFDVICGLVSSMFTEALESPTSHADVRIDSLTPSEACVVLGLRAIRNRLLSDRQLSGKPQDPNRLRTFAHLIVGLMQSDTDGSSPNVNYHLAKCLIILVPRPSLKSIVDNMSSLLKYWISTTGDIRIKLLLCIKQNCLTDRIGLVYVAMAICCTPAGELLKLGEILKSFKNRQCSRSIAYEDRSPPKLDDLIFVTAILTALTVEGNIIGCKPVFTLLLGIFATPVNIGYLFEGAVQIKRVAFAEKYHGKTRQLYAISEILHSCVQDYATQHKWSLQSNTNDSHGSLLLSIVDNDDILVSIEDPDRMNRVMQRSFLKRVLADQERRESIADENGPLDNDENQSVDHNNFALQSEASDNTPKKSMITRKSSRLASLSPGSSQQL